MLTPRDLNRATLARQHLLERHKGEAADVPDACDRALGYAVRVLTPLVIAPAEERWSFPRDPASGLPGIDLDPVPRPEEGLRLLAFAERDAASFSLEVLP
ncbi:hypothetical protein [Nonomuraea sp. SYSU D8015]|uniref:hypothetical protein n=1 Tax=Nonomuraea sp. SYSU D8015 TaxID=2593644 RepID=UPI00166023F7|nr:hypothetical protein [Nonomuraea sp. SYSU D8015]